MLIPQCNGGGKRLPLNHVFSVHFGLPIVHKISVDQADSPVSLTPRLSAFMSECHVMNE